MSRSVLAAGFGILIGATLVGTQEASDVEAQPRTVEFSGTLTRPVKWSPRLELYPAGSSIGRVDVTGSKLNGLAAGTPIWIRGVAKSSLHLGGTPDNPSPFPAQWTLQIEVVDVRVLEDKKDIMSPDFDRKYKTQSESGKS